MSVHYKFVLDKRRKRSDCIYPLKLRIYSESGNKEKGLNIYLLERDWDDLGQRILPTDPNFKTNNYKFTLTKNKIERKVLLTEEEDEEIAPEAIISSITKRQAPKSKITVRSFSNNLIADMVRANKAGNSMAYKDAINSIIKYTGNDRLMFEDITYKLLHSEHCIHKERCFGSKHK